LEVFPGRRREAGRRRRERGTVGWPATVLVMSCARRGSNPRNLNGIKTMCVVCMYSDSLIGKFTHRLYFFFVCQLVIIQRILRDIFLFYFIFYFRFWVEGG
jgi:hypothetical protein